MGVFALKHSSEPPSGIHALELPTAEVSWLPDQRSPSPSNPFGPWQFESSLPGDSGGTAPDSHRTSFTAVAGQSAIRPRRRHPRPSDEMRLTPITHDHPEQHDGSKVRPTGTVLALSKRRSTRRGQGCLEGSMTIVATPKGPASTSTERKKFVEPASAAWSARRSRARRSAQRNPDDEALAVTRTRPAATIDPLLDPGRAGRARGRHLLWGPSTRTRCAAENEPARTISTRCGAKMGRPTHGRLSTYRVLNAAGPACQAAESRLLPPRKSTTKRSSTTQA